MFFAACSVGWIVGRIASSMCSTTADVSGEPAMRSVRNASIEAITVLRDATEALLYQYAEMPARAYAVAVPYLHLCGRVLGGAMLATSRMIVWWGPLAAFYLSLHASAVAQRWRRAHRASPPGIQSAGRIFPRLRRARSRRSPRPATAAGPKARSGGQARRAARCGSRRPAARPPRRRRTRPRCGR